MLNVAHLRAQFPALGLDFNGRQAIFFDNPGGTQVPQQVMDAVSHYWAHSNANVGGAFPTSQRTDRVIADARQSMADLLGASDPHEIVFGANMTSLTFPLARSLADTIRPGDEIVITNLDHDANVSPWTDLQAAGAEIRVVDINPDDCTLDLNAVRAALSERTRLVAVTYASNAVGTIPDVAAISRLAHEVGALVFVDAVQYVPHGPTDVQALGCDFLACSAYKFFGPHIGVLWGKAEHLERLTPHKVRPAKNCIPNRWETGTLNHECLAGVTAAVNYLRDLPSDIPSPPRTPSPAKGEGGDEANNASPLAMGRAVETRTQLLASMAAVKDYERGLSEHLLSILQRFPDIRIYGLTDPARFGERVPTFAFTWPRLTPRQTAEHLAAWGIACWSGNYYALRLMERLGLEGEGGAVRIGLAHYNTREEIDRLGDALAAVPK